MDLNKKLRQLRADDAAFFARAFSGMQVPDDIRRAAERIARAYNIRGTSDPGYIANIIARETGRGDGLGNFTTCTP